MSLFGKKQTPAPRPMSVTYNAAQAVPVPTQEQVPEEMPMPEPVIEQPEPEQPESQNELTEDMVKAVLVNLDARLTNIEAFILRLKSL